MNPTVIAIIALIAILVGPNIIQKIVYPFVQKRLTNHILQNDFDAFDKDVNSLSAKIFIAPFNRDYLRLNAAFLENNKAKINKEIATLESRRLNNKQMTEFYRNIFSYYCNQNDKARAKDYVEKLKAVKNEELGQQAQLIYDVQFEKKTDGIEEVIKMGEGALTAQKPFYYSLVAQMYENRGDNENAKIWSDKSEELVEKLTTAKPVNK